MTPEELQAKINIMTNSSDWRGAALDIAYEAERLMKENEDLRGYNAQCDLIAVENARLWKEKIDSLLSEVWRLRTGLMALADSNNYHHNRDDFIVGDFYGTPEEYARMKLDEMEIGRINWASLWKRKAKELYRVIRVFDEEHASIVTSNMRLANENGIMREALRHYAGTAGAHARRVLSKLERGE